MRMNIKSLTLLGLFTALAFVSTFAQIMVVFPLQYEPKDAVLVVAGFLMGPLAALSAAVTVSLIEMFTNSGTGIFGFLMNSISSGVFCCTAAIIYRRKRTLTGAAFGLGAAVLLTTAVMLPWNYFIMPLFFAERTREMIAGMIVPVLLPFNLLKYSLSAGLAVLLYKPVKSALLRAEFLPSPNVPMKNKINAVAVLTAGFVVVTCGLLILIWRGII
jgi:riboflavin transporter FmnP